MGTALALVVAQAATAGFMLVLARRTSTEDFGSYAGLYGASLSIGALLDFGSSQCQTRELARHIGRPQFRRWLARRSAIQLPAVALFGVLASLVLDGALPAVCTIGLVGQSLAYNLSQGSMAAVRATRSPVMAEWLVGVGNLLMVLALVVCPEHWVLPMAGIGAAGSWMVAAAAGLWVTRHTVGGRRLTTARNPWTGATSFGISSFSTSIQGFAIGAVGWTSGASEAARIGAVNKWGQPIALFAAAYASYMFPAFAGARTNREAVRMLRPLRIIAAAGVGAALVIVIASPLLVDTLLGDQYANATDVLRLLVIAAVPVLLAQPLSALLQARGEERFVARLFVTVNLAIFGGIVLSSFVLGAVSIPLLSFAGSCVLLVALDRRVVRMLKASPPVATA
jgi:O-antigen/teichoic acid export membrane protein